MLRLTAGFVFFGTVFADTYLQNPKGSNNRLNEQSANRNNANRLFDSQNNNRGGYNVADLDDQNGFQDNQNYEGDFGDMYDIPDTNPGQTQYNMMYQEGSMLRMTWTAQHGCGNAMNNCNFVIQFGCDDQDKDETDYSDLDNVATGTRMMLRNGGNTGGLNEPGTNVNNIAGTFDNNNNNRRGRHEAEEFYSLCRNRNRNDGLFTADQNLNGNAQRNTRQNPNGNRSGLECPEERDYYPWTYPSPWRDVVWKGNDAEYCKTNIAPFSQNVTPKYTCVPNGGVDDSLAGNQDVAEANDEDECDDAGGNWVGLDWGEAYTTDAEKAAFNEKLCQEQNWSQVNHLGNVDGTAKGGQMDNYEWWIPSVAELETNWGCHVYTENVDVGGETEAIQFVRGVMRLRYNISTADYDPYQTDAAFNNDPANGVISPVQQNPTVDTGSYMQGLRLALNTAQTGRTFQDRTHVFNIMTKPATLTGTAAALQTAQNIMNVNVRGKRGNIVQTFPAMEYDFEPNDFEIEQDSCIHFQWAGSNTHNNGNPAGDGQAGDAGEGRGGSDRSNIMEMISLRTSYPMAYDTDAAASFLDEVDCRWPMAGGDEWVSALDAKVILATGGYFSSAADAQGGGGQQNENVDPLMNNVSAAFRQGLMCCTRADTAVGDYYFMSTRNNNFSNRSQKMHIKVVAPDATTADKFATFQAEAMLPDFWGTYESAQ